jgi:hypothetical protein
VVGGLLMSLWEAGVFSDSSVIYDNGYDWDSKNSRVMDTAIYDDY